ncbi:hypothetical protein [Staphylococcus equorum]|uniref:hypothetical protein n=1 Tax=Staphylococcus equorum TaxID=246432 RepID=UPI0025575E30|nr:hypothetical protein [Staphylococcus equorum]MDK9853120.1 hypothetical protein [Staphylococcus equorum]
MEKIDGEFEIVLAGCDLVPNKAYDKVLPTTEKIARQADKVYFDGGKLRVKDNEVLSSIEELNKVLKEGDTEVAIPENAAVFDIE